MKDIQIQSNNQNTDLIEKHLQELSEDSKNEILKLAISGQIKLNQKVQEDIIKTQNAETDYERHMDAAQRMQYQSAKDSSHVVKTDINTASGHMHLESRTAKCYVATATYQDNNHPNVVILRGYRDHVLQNNILGRCFISLYYSIGKHLAYLPEHIDWVRRLSKKTIDVIVQLIVRKYYQSLF